MEMNASCTKARIEHKGVENASLFFFLALLCPISTHTETHRDTQTHRSSGVAILASAKVHLL